MSAEHRDRGFLRRPGLGPNTLRRLVGGILDRPDNTPGLLHDPNTSGIIESLAGLGRSLGPLVGESPPEQKTKDEEDD